MSNFKTLTTVAIAAFLATPAVAQEAGSSTVYEPVPEPMAADFSSADLDQDAFLNADEFVTFAVMRAEDGEETYKDIVLGGEYNTAFVSYDSDASGGLEMGELKSQVEADSEAETEEPEEEEVITPEN